MLERSRKSLLDGPTRQRLEGSTRQLFERSRETFAQLVGAPAPPPLPASSQEVLAGVCSSIALRDLNLVDSLLEQLEKMESNEDDPDSLAQLYRLDHLATRLRRNGENLRVLAGRDAGGTADETTALVDVLRAGMSSIEHYTRVELGTVASVGLLGLAADDVSRVLSELLDNATRHSPPTSRVTVNAHRTEQGGVMVRIEDAGIGLPAARLQALNERLASAPHLDRNTVRHMGLAVVRRLASRHGIRVWLARRAPHGTIASVLLPVTLVMETASPAPFRGADQPRGVQPQAPGETSVPSKRGDLSSERTETPKAPETVVSPDPQPARRPQEQDSDSPTTASGLPRRVPHSLRDPSGTRHARDTQPVQRTWKDQHESHAKLLADLGAFAEGEQAAHEETGRTDAQWPVEGHDS
jgi:anti-sigma regulatory factor (Ser/Thr protein kinase)